MNINLETLNGVDYTVFPVDEFVFYVPTENVKFVTDTNDKNHLKNLSDIVYCDGQIVKTLEDA